MSLKCLYFNTFLNWKQTLFKKNTFAGIVLQKYGQRFLQLYLFNGFLLVISRTLVINVLKIVNPWIIVGTNMIFTLGVSMLIIEILSKTELGRFALGE